MGVDDRDDCGPDGHDFSIAQLHVDGLRLRRVSACACGAISYEPSPADYADLGRADTTYESRQPLVSRRDAQDDIG
jgi:hypothetical protein